MECDSTIDSGSSVFDSGAFRRSFVTHTEQLLSPLPVVMPIMQSQAQLDVQNLGSEAHLGTVAQVLAGAAFAMVPHHMDAVTAASISPSSGSPSPAWWDRLRDQQEQRRSVAQQEADTQRAASMAAAISAEHKEAQWLINRHRLLHSGASSDQQPVRRVREKQQPVRLTSTSQLNRLTSATAARTELIVYHPRPPTASAREQMVTARLTTQA